ncbi:MAG TPA: ribosome biogenesis factor YjgA [Burkholderiaceae bacterium]|nr:ribosome biogenesis factor YjgA [Burkholderiaceae bacterium]
MKPAPRLAAPEEPAISGAHADARPSKTRRKQEMTALQQLGEDLLRLTPAQLARIDLPEALRDALRETRRITAHEGRRRQLQYIGRLMRQVDPEPVRRALDDATGASRAAVALMHRCERLRDRLLEDDAALTDFLSQHPHVDVQHLRALIRAARKDLATGATPKHARDLYRWLHEALQPEGGGQ